MSSSRWRKEARRAITETLAGLPAGVTDKERRAALRRAYPFGQREHHPYRIWLNEVQRAIGTSKVPIERDSQIVLDTSSGEMEVRVQCGWCGGKNCLGCLALRRRLERQRHLTDWLHWWQWLQALDDDPVTYAAFADWLEENDWPEEARRVRRLA